MSKKLLFTECCCIFVTSCSSACQYYPWELPSCCIDCCMVLTLEFCFGWRLSHIDWWLASFQIWHKDGSHSTLIGHSGQITAPCRLFGGGFKLLSSSDKGELMVRELSIHFIMYRLVKCSSYAARTLVTWHFCLQVCLSCWLALANKIKICRCQKVSTNHHFL